MHIIDGHVHIFRNVHGNNNFGSVRSEKFGRVVNGGLVKPFMPPLSADTSFSVEQLLETMGRSGVEKALLLQNPTIGIMNDEIEKAVVSYPDRFAGTVQIDPFSVNATDILETLAQKKVFTALKLEMSDDWGWLSVYPHNAFNFTLIYPLLEISEMYKLSVIFDPGRTVGVAYLPEQYRAMVDAFPELNFIIEHMGYWTKDGDHVKYENMLELGKKNNVFFGISAVGQLIEDEYPCERAQELIRHAYEVMGADKLIWGSDAPTTLNRYTYQQMIDFILLHNDFLNDSEREKIMYRNADLLYF